MSKRIVRNTWIAVVSFTLTIGSVLGIEAPSYTIENLEICKTECATPVKDLSKGDNSIHLIIDGKDVTKQLAANEKPILTKDNVVFLSLQSLQKNISKIELGTNQEKKIFSIGRVSDNDIAFQGHVMPDVTQGYVVTADLTSACVFKAENAPTLYDNNLYIPASFVTDSLNYEIAWDSLNKALGISTLKGVKPVTRIAEKETTKKDPKQDLRLGYLGGTPYYKQPKDKVSPSYKLSISRPTGLEIHLTADTIDPSDSYYSLKLEPEGKYNSCGYIRMSRNAEKGTFNMKQLDEAEALLKTFLPKKDALEVMKNIRTKVNANLKGKVFEDVTQYNSGSYVIEYGGSFNMNYSFTIIILIKK